MARAGVDPHAASPPGGGASIPHVSSKTNAGPRLIAEMTVSHAEDFLLHTLQFFEAHFSHMVQHLAESHGSSWRGPSPSKNFDPLGRGKSDWVIDDSIL